MTNSEIISSLHKMVDKFAALLAEPMLEGTLPLVRVSLKPDENGHIMRLTVGVDFADDETD